MVIDIKIAVLPLVKAYLEYNYGGEPFKLGRDNQYGIFLFNSLTHAQKVAKILPELDINTGYYSETLKIRLTERIRLKQGSIILPDKQTAFNRMVMYSINETFLLFTEERLLARKQPDKRVFISHKQIFMEFREKFGLCEDNLPLKTMEKRYERARMALSA